MNDSKLEFKRRFAKRKKTQSDLAILKTRNGHNVKSGDIDGVFKCYSFASSRFALAREFATRPKNSCLAGESTA